MVDWNKGECYQELEFKLKLVNGLKGGIVSDKFKIIFSLQFVG